VSTQPVFEVASIKPAGGRPRPGTLPMPGRLNLQCITLVAPPSVVGQAVVGAVAVAVASVVKKNGVALTRESGAAGPNS
jgi:hypothetical protein